MNAENVRALKLLRADPRITVLRFSDELVREFGRLAKEVIAELATKDPLTRKVADSYMTFLAGIMDWGELSETGYRNTRRLALGMFPDKELAFNLIFWPRLQRLMRERFRMQ